MAQRARSLPQDDAMRYLMEVYTDERAQQQRLEEDVRQGLTARQKSLPPKYFYDRAGSILFERITELPEYYPTRTESTLLGEIVPGLFRDFFPDEIVEIRVVGKDPADPRRGERGRAHGAVRAPGRGPPDDRVQRGPADARLQPQHPARHQSRCGRQLPPRGLPASRLLQRGRRAYRDAPGGRLGAAREARPPRVDDTLQAGRGHLDGELVQVHAGERRIDAGDSRSHALRMARGPLELLRPRPRRARLMRADVVAYAQPTPRRLYVHDDLSDHVARRCGAGSPAALLARDLLAAVALEAERVRLLTLGEQVERVVAQGAHAPFAIAIGVGSAGRRVAEALHERAGWFPRIRRVGLTREEDGRGGYHLISTETAELAAQLARIDPLADGASLAVVDDTVFSGLTMRSVLEALPAATRARTRAFCLRGVAESIAAVAALCPITAGVAAPGRLLEDVSFINASGLVRRIAIRRRGQPPLAFFERPEWIRAWFPAAHAEVLTLCRRLNALLEPHPRPS